MSYPSLFVLEYELVSYRRTWRGSVFSSFLLPVLFFLGIGISVGAYVDSSGTLGVAYDDFIAPGLLVSTALQVAIGEVTWPVLGAIMWNRSYHAMRATSLRLTDILVGHLQYTLLRVGMSAAGFLIVMALFGTVHSWRGVAAFPVALLVGAAAAAPGFAYTATIKHDNMLALLMRFAVIPMTLFAGVFFPVEGLPIGARLLAYVSPLWHGVELARAATLGTPVAWTVTGHLAYLVVWIVAGYLLARSAFIKRLTDL